jgi:hypothetical protein
MLFFFSFFSFSPFYLSVAKIGEKIPLGSSFEEENSKLDDLTALSSFAASKSKLDKKEIPQGPSPWLKDELEQRAEALKPLKTEIDIKMKEIQKHTDRAVKHAEAIKASQLEVTNGHNKPFHLNLAEEVAHIRLVNK